LKKLAGSVRFYKQKTEKTEPNRIRKKPSQTGKTEKTEPNRKNRAKTGKTEPNRFEPVFALKNRTEPKSVGLTRFRFGFGFFFKKNNFGLVTFFDKNRTEPKMITPISHSLYTV
jgi:hypothetical protein